MDRKNVYKIVDNVDNSENRRKYRKIAVNKNVRNYLAKRQIAVSYTHLTLPTTPYV